MEPKGRMQVMAEVHNALDMMLERFGPESTWGRGMFPPKTGLMGAPDGRPASYSEFMKNVMDRDPMVSMVEKRHLDTYPFDYICRVWRDVRKNDYRKDIREGLSELRSEWLRHLALQDPDLDEEQRKHFAENLRGYWFDNFVERLDGDGDFWAKEGNKEVWLISMALAIPRFLDTHYDACADAKFLNVKLPNGSKILEGETSEW